AYQRTLSRGRFLIKIPLPSIRETLSEVKTEEAKQKVMMGSRPLFQKLMALLLLLETIGWKLHGRPVNVKKKGEGCALQATTSDQKQQSPSNSLLLTTKQLEQLYKLPESQAFLVCSPQR
ncbi:hypothetical protein A2U01_0018612, partial [Trifolium medium]|nr:hypothetical protein [Trifolium medium]